jgi:hypothetical protein
LRGEDKMEEKKCPLCGTTLIEEFSKSESHGSSSEKEVMIPPVIIPSGCSNYSGSIDVFTASGSNNRTKTTIYACPNPECGYLSFDC